MGHFSSFDSSIVPSPVSFSPFSPFTCDWWPQVKACSTGISWWWDLVLAWLWAPCYTSSTVRLPWGVISPDCLCAGVCLVSLHFVDPDSQDTSNASCTITTVCLYCYFRLEHYITFIISKTNKSWMLVNCARFILGWYCLRITTGYSSSNFNKDWLPYLMYENYSGLADHFRYRGFVLIGYTPPF